MGESADGLFLNAFVSVTVFGGGVTHRLLDGRDDDFSLCRSEGSLFFQHVDDDLSHDVIFVDHLVQSVIETGGALAAVKLAHALAGCLVGDLSGLSASVGAGG